jgi:hypothetical protein
MQRMLIHTLLGIPYSDVCIIRTAEGKPIVVCMYLTCEFVYHDYKTLSLTGDSLNLHLYTSFEMLNVEVRLDWL